MHAYKLICGLLCWLIALPVWSSYAIYIGKNLTADGSVMIGGSGDEVSSHWLEVVPAATHAKDAMIIVGVTDCLLYTSPSPRDYAASRMPSSA